MCIAVITSPHARVFVPTPSLRHAPAGALSVMFSSLTVEMLFAPRLRSWETVALCTRYASGYLSLCFAFLKLMCDLKRGGLELVA